MRVLLDTHIALWAVTGSGKLTPEAVKAILDADEVFVSAASVWEIAIKRSLDKSKMPITSAKALQAFQDAGYRVLEVKAAHAVQVEQLPRIHKDPFDRMLVAQALCEPLTLITRDAVVAQYRAAIMRVQ